MSDELLESLFANRSGTYLPVRALKPWQHDQAGVLPLEVLSLVEKQAVKAVVPVEGNAHLQRIFGLTSLRTGCIKISSSMQVTWTVEQVLQALRHLAGAEDIDAPPSSKRACTAAGPADTPASPASPPQPSRHSPSFWALDEAEAVALPGQHSQDGSWCEEQWLAVAVLGRGSYATVIAAHNPSTGCSAALKVYNHLVEPAKQKASITNCARELAIFRRAGEVPGYEEHLVGYFGSYSPEG